jgi:hypothetical protein
VRDARCLCMRAPPAWSAFPNEWCAVDNVSSMLPAVCDSPKCGANQLCVAPDTCQCKPGFTQTGPTTCVPGTPRRRPAANHVLANIMTWHHLAIRSHAHCRLWGALPRERYLCRAERVRLQRRLFREWLCLQTMCVLTLSTKVTLTKRSHCSSSPSPSPPAVH